MGYRFGLMEGSVGDEVDVLTADDSAQWPVTLLLRFV